MSCIVWYECVSAEEGFGVDQLLALVESHLLALFEEVLWGTSKYREGIEVHWDEGVHVG
jgi:hypothetical protein